MDWKTILEIEQAREYYPKLNDCDQLLPPPALRLRALELTPFDLVKVVIIGQDPYFHPGQADGLAFSVPSGVALPPTLRNIFRELESDLGIACPASGDLSAWAREGVLLLNSILTVVPGRPLSCRNLGWERLTDAIITHLNNDPTPKVFILWGRPAQAKMGMIASPPHLVIASSHPSPLGAYRSFFGSRPFSRANDFLVASGRLPVDWSL